MVTPTWGTISKLKCTLMEPENTPKSFKIYSVSTNVCKGYGQCWEYSATAPSPSNKISETNNNNCLNFHNRTQIVFIGYSYFCFRSNILWNWGKTSRCFTYEGMGPFFYFYTYKFWGPCPSFLVKRNKTFILASKFKNSVWNM